MLQRQSEDYDYDGPTQDPISAQLGLVADSNRCQKYSAVFSEKMIQYPLKQPRPYFGKALVSFKSLFSSTSAFARILLTSSPATGAHTATMPMWPMTARCLL